LLAAILVPYFALALFASVQQGRRYGFGIALPLPGLFFAYHFSYGLGTLWGAVRLLFGATPVQGRKGKGRGRGQDEDGGRRREDGGERTEERGRRTEEG